MNEQPELDLNALPAWARKGLEAGARRTANPIHPPIVSDLHAGPEWSLLLDAALSSSFLPRELAPGELTGAERERAEQSVLDFADQVHDPVGLRWSLSREARAKAIEASTKDELLGAAQRTSKRFGDPVSGALRRLAAEGPPQDAEEPALDILEALRTAVSLLGSISSLVLPSLEELDRQVQLRRLRAGFERMTGAGAASGGPGGRADRFFGREEEMEALRSYVDVVAAEGAANMVGRIVSRVKRAFVEAPPMSVWGTGGVGKTTLMAKFMLEHACAADGRYPFAYLDFDRSTVSARDPAGLLGEMCRQVAVQFTELNDPLRDLAVRLGQAGRRIGSESIQSSSLLGPYQKQFRDLVDGHLDSVESKFSRLRPFLLVFDTFEVVQYSPEDVKALENFVGQFAASDERRLWPRLRLVIAGRRSVTRFLRPVRQLTLGPLKPAGAREMLQALAGDLGLKLSRADVSNLVAALAQAGGQPNDGVHPLRVRLVVEVFRHSMAETRPESQQLTGKALVDSLIADLRRPDSDISAELVNGFLVRRILDHLTDSRVRALADPGLVVRLITPDVIREVLAQSTPEPVEDKTDSSDSLDFKPWALETAAAEEIYEAFKREVTLVDSDGKALRFRQDVRKEMIPLIRIRRKQRFRRLHEVAWRYFAGLADKDPADFVSAGEAVYHGLWLELPLATVGRYWPASPALEPRIDTEEFDPMGNAGLFVRVRSGDRLNPNEVEAVGPELAGVWLERRSDTLLQETSLNEAVASLRAAAGEDFQALRGMPAVAANVARVCFRAGEWDDAAGIAERMRIGESPSYSDDPALSSLFRTWLTVVAKAGVERDDGPARLQTSGVSDPVVRVELLAHLLLARNGLDPGDGQLNEAIAQVSPNHWASEPRILRLAILLGDADQDLVSFYLGAAERLPRNRSIAKTVRELFIECYRDSLDASTEEPYGQLMESGEDYQAFVTTTDALFRLDKTPLLRALGRADIVARCISIIAADHRDWIRPLTFAVDRLLRANSKASEDIAAALSPARGRGRGRSKAPPTAFDSVIGANDDGKLIPLARALVQIDGSNPGARYPHTAGAIAAALLDWDARLKDRRPRGGVSIPPKPA